jgi:hypothetical protein
LPTEDLARAGGTAPDIPPASPSDDRWSEHLKQRSDGLAQRQPLRNPLHENFCHDAAN